MAYNSSAKRFRDSKARKKFPASCVMRQILKFPVSLRKDLRSSLPHARIVKIDKSKAERLPGVRAIITGRRHTCGDGWSANERHAFVGD